MFQIQAPESRHLTTAHLAQTMSLLGLTIGELRQRIEAELARNPALELVEERRCPTCHKKLTLPGPCPVCTSPSLSHPNEPIVFLSERQDFYPGSGLPPEDMPEDDLAPAAQDLATFVLRQIAPELEPADRLLAAHLLTSLDERGLLPTPLIEFARYHHVPVSRVEAVVRLIQHAEPLGVGSPSPQAAMLVQIQILSESQPVPPLAEKAVQVGMDLLSRRQYAELARLLGVKVHRIEEIVRFITDNLNPHPASAHWGDIHQGSAAPLMTYAHPDIVLHLLDEKDTTSPLVAEIITPLRGSLRINPLFRQAFLEADPERLEQWKSDLEQASLLIKCLQQRNNTMRRLVYQLSRLQRQFILHGDAHLIPMTRAYLADLLGVHESTISRAVAGKCAQIPSGHILPLERFFDRSLQVRTALRSIVAAENRPLTDTQIAALLRNRGYDVARRTVAKYRAMEGILPARLRQPSCLTDRCP
jgi:RNA polymerase sigma-54 factor